MSSTAASAAGTPPVRSCLHFCKVLQRALFCLGDRKVTQVSGVTTGASEPRSGADSGPQSALHAHAAWLWHHVQSVYIAAITHAFITYACLFVR